MQAVTRAGAPEAETHSFRSADDPSLVIEASAEPSSGEFCASFPVRARITDSLSGIDPSTITAHIQHPDGVDVTTITLYDDGTHGDELAGDDIFTGEGDSCVAVEEATYYADIEASDNQGITVYADNVATFEIHDLPVIFQVNHHPSEPTDTDAVIGMASISDRSGISSAGLFYSSDGGNTYVPVPILCDAEMATCQGTVSPREAVEMHYRIDALDSQGHLVASGMYSYTVTPATPPLAMEAWAQSAV
ncbi:MAG: choice-of-anchor X domain-containing protein [Anaerolineae bacterium]